MIWNLTISLISSSYLLGLFSSFKGKGGYMIKLLRLVNIQSYEDITFKFDNGINVLTAPNETGKSIMFKVFRKMCDYNWYGRGDKSLIRRGCEKGTVLIVADRKDSKEGDYFNIIFEVYKTYQIYRLFDSNSNELGVWKQNTLPIEIASILGWYYNSESKILLNLCDQELDMPFVNSNLRFNFESLKFIICDDELDKARLNISNWIRELESSRDVVIGDMRHYEGKISAYDFVDTTDLKISIEKRRNTVNIAEHACNLLESLQNCVEQKMPEFKRVDEDKVSECISKADMLRNLGLTLQSALTTKKPTMVEVDTDRLERCIDVCKSLSVLKYNLSNLRYTMESMKACDMRIQNSKELIEDFEKQHELCPLCGSKFNKRKEM